MRTIAFDVDSTLITLNNQTGEDVPRYSNLALLHWFYKNTDWDIVVWSGGGVDYARRWCEKLGIDKLVTIEGKGDCFVDLTVDDVIDFQADGRHQLAVNIWTPDFGDDDECQREKIKVWKHRNGVKNE